MWRPTASTSSPGGAASGPGHRPGAVKVALVSVDICINTMAEKRRILLIDPEEQGAKVLAERLGALGFEVATAADGADGARLALETPAVAIVADLFMPSISGAQLCRLLNSEPATARIPVILRGPEGHRNRFWAEETGAYAYVIKGKMGDLVRALNRGTADRAAEGPVVTPLPETKEVDVRDRIASYLDTALFESVIAAEIRRLAVCESFQRLFDFFAQFAARVTSYRWLGLTTHSPRREALHAHPQQWTTAIAEASSVWATPWGTTCCGSKTRTP